MRKFYKQTRYTKSDWLLSWVAVILALVVLIITIKREMRVEKQLISPTPDFCSQCQLKLDGDYRLR